MRLTFLTNVFPNPIAPTKGTFNLELAKSLAEHCDLTMVVPVAWTDRVRSGQRGRDASEAEPTICGIRTLYPTYWYTPGFARSQYDKCMGWSLASTLRRVAAEARPDAVLSYWAHPDGAVATAWAHSLGLPSWMMIGGSDVLLLSKESGRGLVIRRALDAADGIIAVSQDIANQLAKQGIDSEKVQVIRRGVDSSRFHPRDRQQARRDLRLDTDGPLLVWVGRMVPVKGLERLLDAVAEAKRRGARLQLALVGDGPLRRSLESRARELDLVGDVRFAGSVPHAELAAWYQAADWTVLTSLSEGIPNVLLESHACGTPFIATAVGGVPEIAVEGADRLVPADDAEALAASLLEVTSSKSTISPELLSESVGTLFSAACRVLSLLKGSMDAAASSAGCHS